MSTRRRRATIVATICALLLSAGAALRAQPLSVGVPAATNTAPPGVTQEGIYSTVPVRVDGAQIFRIAIAQSPELTQSAAQSAVALRGQVTQAAIGQILAEQEDNRGTIYDPETLRVTAEARENEAVISAADKTHVATPLLAVTEADAQYNRLPIDAVTERWRAKLQESLVNGLRTRQPESYARSIAVARWLIIVLLVLTAILAFVYYLLARRIRALQAIADQAESDAKQAQAELAGRDVDDVERERLLAVVAEAVEPRTRLRVLRSGLAAIGWTGVAFWVVGILVVMSLFPATMPLAVELVERVVAIAAILVIATLVIRIGDIVVQRAFLAWQNNAPPEERTRRALRTPTIVGAVNGFMGTVVYFIAGLAILSQLGFPALSVIAVGGIAAVALSLAAQSLIQDVVNGFFVLFEDQYAVGDFVVIGAHEGLVEYVSLRIVRIRDDRGGVVTIPHSQARIVVNESRHWSRVDYRVTIAAGADVERALAIVRSAIETLAKDPEWTEADIELEFIGVQSISRMGIVVRARVRTAAGDQWRVSRELYRRIAAEFSKAEIALGVDPVTAVATIAE
jgi:moderate conductance mechanosensitive channel